jgi:hypothetical protein
VTSYQLGLKKRKIVLDESYHLDFFLIFVSLTTPQMALFKVKICDAEKDCGAKNLKKITHVTAPHLCLSDFFLIFVSLTTPQMALLKVKICDAEKDYRAKNLKKNHACHRSLCL